MTAPGTVVANLRRVAWGPEHSHRALEQSGCLGSRLPWYGPGSLRLLHSLA